MPIVMAGKTFTAAELKHTAGDLAARLTEVVQDGTDYAGQLASWTEADLVALGLTVAEVNAIKGFFIGDLPAIRTALQASTWIRQLLGTGVQ